MQGRDELSDQLSAVLSWLHDRLGHSFTVGRGHELHEGVLLRGREPTFCFGEEGSESYVLDVFAPAMSLRVSSNDLDDVELLDHGSVLRLTFAGGDKLDIADEG